METKGSITAMLVLDTPHSDWKNALKAHEPIRFDPDQRDHTVYHLTALSKKVAPPNPTQKFEGSNRGMAYREQREIGLRGDPSPETKSYMQQVKDVGLDPKWQNASASKGKASSDASAARSEISSAAQALWRQYVALMAGRPVGPLPTSVIEACASYAASKQVVAA